MDNQVILFLLVEVLFLCEISPNLYFFQLQDLDYEDEPTPPPPQQSQSARVVSMTSRVVEPRIYQRGSTPMLTSSKLIFSLLLLF